MTQERPPGTRQQKPDESGRYELKARQSAVLQAAYRAALFEWPRPVSSEDIASPLDIAPPTFHQHLRKAEKHVFDTFVPALLSRGAVECRQSGTASIRPD